MFDSLFDPARDIDQLRAEAAACTNCHLYENATQTVFGQGPSDATVMLVGEQPGDKEDIAGDRFVGPAGKLLNDALDEAGIDRSKTYVTNTVKHFRWKPAGKVRLHQKPNAGEIKACRPWLEAEMKTLQPKVVVLLGATAAQAMFGSTFRVTKQRGEFLPIDNFVDSAVALATVHPSSILRAPDEAARAEQYAGFVEDLKVVASRL